MTTQVHRMRTLFIASAVLVAVALLSASAALIIAIRKQDWDPLGPYRPQAVTNRVPGVRGPAVRAGDALIVEGTLCSKVDTLVRTTISWQGLLPSGAPRDGALITVAIAVPQRRAKGCVTFDRAHGNAFVNPMRDEVLAAIDAGVTRWRVVGFELPIGTDGSPGRAQGFETQPFEVVVR